MAHVEGNKEFCLGDAVRVNINGIVVGRSEFTDGDDSYLVQYERARQG